MLNWRRARIPIA